MRILPTSHISHQKYLTPDHMFPSYVHLHNHVLLHLYCSRERTSLPSEAGVKEITKHHVRVRLYRPPGLVINREAHDPLKTLLAGLLGVSTADIFVWGTPRGKAETVEVAGGTAAGWGGWRRVKKLLEAKKASVIKEEVRRIPPEGIQRKDESAPEARGHEAIDRPLKLYDPFHLANPTSTVSLTSGPKAGRRFAKEDFRRTPTSGKEKKQMKPRISRTRREEPS